MNHLSFSFLFFYQNILNYLPISLFYSFFIIILNVSSWPVHVQFNINKQLTYCQLILMGLCYLTGETRKREINAYPITEMQRKEMKVPHISIDFNYLSVVLEAGKEYEYCTCGLSKTQPFCDGSHKGTPFLPLKFTSEQQKKCFLCLCKKTKSPPYCDNSHKRKRDLDF